MVGVQQASSVLNRESTCGIECRNSQGGEGRNKTQATPSMDSKAGLEEVIKTVTTEQPCHSRVNEQTVCLWWGGRGSACKWGVTEDSVLDQLAGRAERAVGHGCQQGCVYLHPLIKGVDFDSRHLFRDVKLHGKGNVTEGVQGAQMDGLPMLCQDFNVR